MKWFEYLPESWAILRTKQMFRLVIEKAPANNQMELLSVYTHIGVRPRKSLEQRGNKASTTDGYWVVKEGDIICNKLLAWMGAIGASHYQGVTSPAYDILTPIKSCNTDYYHFLFRTKKYLQQFKIRSRGIMDMRLRLYFDQFGQIPIPVPPRPEQDQIVAYLRAQDVHIARFIKAKRELIKLLTEQKRRIIDHAVTRGLDVSVALKPSGIEWLGDVPVHCRIERLKWVCRFTYGDSLSDANRRQGNVPVYGSNGPVGMHDVANVVGPCIVIGRKGSFGKVNYSESDLFAIDTTYFVDKKCTKANIRWLYYVLIWCRLDRISKDSAVPGLDRTDALNTLVPVPDGAEQEQIAKQLDIETAEVNDAITKVEEEITLIREYRDRLITDVVTGQVDVRGWQPDVEDVVEDAVLAALGDDQEEMTEQEDDDDED
nr:restriction endonuclease subunit S [Xylella fastidiosa]